MKCTSRFLKVFFIIFFIVISQSSNVYALGTCPGVTRQLTWSVTGAYTSCPTKQVAPGGSAQCQFVTDSGTKSVTLAANEACTVQFQCENGTGNLSAPASDTLTVTNGPSCCNTGSQVGLTVWDGTTCVAPAVVNGSCGTSNGSSFTSAPTSGLCGDGSLPAVSGSGPWTWSCAGSNGGTTASCSAGISCTRPNGTTNTSYPGPGCPSWTNYCTGPSDPVNPYQRWSTAYYTVGTYIDWVPLSPNDQSPLFCSQAVCGTSNGGSFTSAPTTGLCAPGTASAVSGSGPWSWTCTQSSNTATCNASLTTFSCGGTAPTGGNFAQRGAVTANGTWAYATGGECTWSCNTGFHQVGNSCVADTVTCPAENNTQFWGACSYPFNTVATTFGTAGTALSTNTTGYTGALTRTCQSNGTWANSNGSCTINPAPSGWITATQNPCTILSGASNCTSNIKWDTANTPSASVTVPGLFSSSASNPITGQDATWIGHTATTFNLNDANNNVLASVSVSGACTTGTSWDAGTGTCQPLPCPNGANNPSACNTCTAPLVWNTTSTSCVNPLSVSVNPATYSVTLPSNVITALYTLTNGTGANTNCRLLDNAGNPLTAYASCSLSLSVTAPSIVGAYAYSIQASKAQTAEVKTSNSFTVNVNPNPVCTNGATNWSACDQCPSGLWWDGTTSSCQPCGNGGCNGGGGSSINPNGTLTCINGSTDVHQCTLKPVVSILVGGGTNIFISNYTPHTESLVWSATGATSCVGGGDWTSTPSPFNGGSAFTSSLVNGLSTSKVFTYPYSCTNAGGTTLATASATVCPSNLPVWNGASCQPLPTNTGFVIDYLAYPLMTPANFNISCADSDSFSLYNNGSFLASYSVPHAPIPATASGQYSVICKKTSADGHLFTSAPAIRNYSILPPPPIVSIKQTPATISRGTATVISWEVQYPTAQCALNAVPVCANASCTDAQLQAANDVNTIITSQLTDTNDLGGVGRLISDAIRTIVPQALSGRQDWKAFGKKTFNLSKSMDFELNCHGTGPYERQKVRVLVTSSNEG